MTAITITAKGDIRRSQIPRNGKPLYKFIQEKIGGYSEYTYPSVLGDNRVMIANEEGKLLHFPVNDLATLIFNGGVEIKDIIVGDVVIAKIGKYRGESDVIGLEEHEADEIIEAIKKACF